MGGRCGALPVALESREVQDEKAGVLGAVGEEGKGHVVDGHSSPRPPLERPFVGVAVEGGGDAVDHVLSGFHPSERKRLDELLDTAADAVEGWARDGLSKAANRFNSFALRPPDESRVAPPGEIDGPPGADGIRRTRTGWRKIRRDASPADRAGAGDEG